MKTIFKIIATVGISAFMASCTAVNDPYYGQGGQHFPNDGRVYRAPDGQVYRQGEVYRDRNGNVYQNGHVIRTGGVYGNYPSRTNLPPGQAKKVYGGQATDYAKGQQKKRDGYYGRWNDDDRRWKEGNKKYKNKKYKNKKYKDRYDD